MELSNEKGKRKKCVRSVMRSADSMWRKRAFGQDMRKKLWSGQGGWFG